MKRILSERTIVAILFILVILTFSFAQHESKQIEQQYFDNLPATKGTALLLHNGATDAPQAGNPLQ